MLLSSFLIERLANAGVKHIFGVPGDYVLDFYSELAKGKQIEVITNTDEAHAGFAADAYARVNGIGCVCVTYNVGASKLINAVQCAYAERSPLVVISGAPGLKEREEALPLLRSYDSQRKMFEEITCCSIVLDNLATAGYVIDSAFEMLRHYKRPIYIELPRDIAKKPLTYDVYTKGTPVAPASDPDQLLESVEEVEAWIKKSERPIIIAGVELARCGLGDSLVKFAERNNVPVASTLLSKSVISELHPLFKGVYCGSGSIEKVQDLVENSDCLLMLGVLATDNIIGNMPAKTKKRLAVMADIEGLQVKSHRYPKVQFVDFCKTLFKKELGRQGINPVRATVKLAPFQPEAKKKITTARLFEKINTILDENTAIVCDIGDCMFGAADLVVHSSHRFMCPAFYTSMGVAIPGALGVQTASPGTRPIVVVGDGASQMSLLELSTIARRNLNPIVFVLNNGGFLTQRIITDGYYNKIHPWAYHKVVDVIGVGQGYEVHDEASLDIAVDKALISKQLSVINVHVDPDGMSPGLKRMMEAMRQK